MNPLINSLLPFHFSLPSSSLSPSLSLSLYTLFTDNMHQAQKTEKMYKRENENPNKTHKNPPKIPSFSSSLLDEIYKSIDQGNEKALNPKILKNRVLEKQSNFIGTVVREIPKNRNQRPRKDEIEAITRASLIDNWIQKNNLNRNSKQFEFFDKNPIFISSSGSTPSLDPDYSIGGKPIKIKTKKTETASDHEQGEFYFMENYHNFQSGKNNQAGVKNDENLIKSKSRAYKIYNNLKKIKQPISPGGRLTSFLNSLFNNGVSSKKTKNHPSPTISTCSSASSYTRSCMSRNSSKTNKKSVSFHPRNVIIGEENGDKYFHKGDLKENKRIEDDDEDDDMASDSSSDLFELDHLAFVGNNLKYSEELPVYETTRFHTNIGIASGLI